MAYQVAQVFYVVDPTSEYWHVMLHGKKETNNEHEQAIVQGNYESGWDAVIY